MYCAVRLFLAVGVLGLVGFATTANAQDKTDAAGNSDGLPIIKHRIIPPDAAAGITVDQADEMKAPVERAPTSGTTGTRRPPIAYHGGPVINTPTAYVIWYGNWNQNNGSDTSAGQQIVRD